MKISTAFGRFILLLLMPFLLLFVRFSWIMDSDDSSASVLDNMDGNLDCVLDVDLNSATPSTSTPMDVTLAVTATAAAV